MGFFGDIVDRFSGAEKKEAPKAEPTQQEISDGQVKVGTSLKKASEAHKKGDKEKEVSGGKADIDISLFTIVDKFSEELGLDKGNDEQLDQAQKLLGEFILEKCTIPNTTPPQVDAVNLKNWTQNLEKLIQTGNPSGLEMLKKMISSEKNEDKVEHREDKVEHREDKVEQKEDFNFDEKLKSLKKKNASSSEYFNVIYTYLKFKDIPESKRVELESYKKLFSLPVSNPQDAAIIKQAALGGLIYGKPSIDVVATLFENESLSEESKAQLKQAFPDFPDTRTETGVEKYALKKEEHFEQTKKELTEKEEESKKLDDEVEKLDIRVEELRFKRDSEGLDETEEKELLDIEEKLNQLKKEKEDLKTEQKNLEKEVQNMSDPETGKLSFDFRLQKATVKNSEIMELKWPSGREYEIRIDTQTGGLEKTYEKIAFIESMGGLEGETEATLLMNIRNKDNIPASDAKIGNTSFPDMKEKLGIDHKDGEVMSIQDQKELNRMMGCLKGPGTPLENLQSLGILNPQGIVDDQKWEQTLIYMRENKDNQNFLTFRYLKEHLDKGEEE